MRNLIALVFMLIAVASTGCEATRGGAGAQGGSTAPTLTAAWLEFAVALLAIRRRCRFWLVLVLTS